MFDTAILMIPGFLNNVGVTELLLILLIILLLFGSTKIPALMRGVGQGVVEFKKGMSEARQVGQEQQQQQNQQQAQAVQPPAQPTAPAPTAPPQQNAPQQK